MLPHSFQHQIFFHTFDLISVNKYLLFIFMQKKGWRKHLFFLFTSPIFYFLVSLMICTPSLLLFVRNSKLIGADNASIFNT